MISLLTDILTSNWLIHDGRRDAYAAILLSLLRGEKLSDASWSEARQRCGAYATTASMNERLGIADESIPEGSIAVIPILSEILKYDQPCGPRGSVTMAREIARANQNPRIDSILLVVDSPGGQVAYTDILSDAVSSSAKPVVAYVEGIAASAAYWIVSGASRIIASSPNDQIGSIGTMLFFADLKPYYESLGVKFHELYATASTEKNADLREVLEGRYDGYRQKVLDPVNERFHAAVLKNRPGLHKETLTGGIYFAPQALSLGLIDEIGSMETAINSACRMAKSKQYQSQNQPNTVNMKITQKLSSLWNSLFASSTDQEMELSAEDLEKLNEKISSLETDLKLARSENDQANERIASLEQKLLKAHADFEALKSSDAATETLAPKEADRFDAREDTSAGFIHNRIADRL